MIPWTSLRSQPSQENDPFQVGKYLHIKIPKRFGEIPI